MKKRNIILVIALFVSALVLLFFGLSKRWDFSVPTQSEAVTEAPAYSGSVFSSAKEYLDTNPAESYLVVRTDGYVYSPVPLNEDGTFRITQPDGSENVVHVGKNSFYMESSNCENQNCVEEGEVTLENKDSRILFNMVYCLPHKLSLELLTPEQAEVVLRELFAQQEIYEALMEAQNKTDDTGAAK